MVDFNSVKIGNCNLYMEFKTGELEVSPNRETLKQSDSNKKKILPHPTLLFVERRGEYEIFGTFFFISSGSWD